MMDEQMIEAIAAELYTLSHAARIEWDEWNDDGDDKIQAYPVRLQLFDGGCTIWHGSPDFDSDHRGDWGSSFITQEMTLEECQSIAQDLVDQALEMQAQRA